MDRGWGSRLLISKSIVLFACMAILNGCCWTNCSAPTPTPVTYASSAVLSTPYQAQITDVWCWAASEQMVLESFGHYYTQNYIVEYVYGYDAPEGGTMTQMQVELYNLGGISTEITGPLTFQEVEAEITKGHPVIIHYTDTTVPGGHFVVLYGYNAIDGTVYINDPFYGRFQPGYTQSFNYVGEGNLFVWDASLVIAN